MTFHEEQDNQDNLNLHRNSRTTYSFWYSNIVLINLSVRPGPSYTASLNLHFRVSCRESMAETEIHVVIIN